MTNFSDESPCKNRTPCPRKCSTSFSLPYHHLCDGDSPHNMIGFRRLSLYVTFEKRKQIKNKKFDEDENEKNVDNSPTKK